MENKNIDTKFYGTNGFLIVPGLFSQAEVSELKRETTAIFRGERGQIGGLLNAEGLTDIEVLQQYIAIHFPHKLSALIRDTLAYPKIVAVLEQLIGPNIKCMQSMLFVKGPGKAGQSWHQDEYYIPTRDLSLTGAWIALDDATVANGCLWIIPGSHRPAWLHRRIPNKISAYADVDVVDAVGLEDDAVPVELESGSVVFFNGYTLHSSQRNVTKDSFRMALVNHYMSAESMLPWDQDGKLPPTEDLRDIVMVAGKDPYAWKGTVDVTRPYLRPAVLRIKTEL